MRLTKIRKEKEETMKRKETLKKVRERRWPKKSSPSNELAFKLISTIGILN